MDTSEGGPRRSTLSREYLRRPVRGRATTCLNPVVLALAAELLLAATRRRISVDAGRQVGLLHLFGCVIGAMKLCFYGAIDRIRLGVAVAMMRHEQRSFDANLEDAIVGMAEVRPFADGAVRGFFTVAIVRARRCRPCPSG